MIKLLVLALSYALVAAAGFAAGVYFLPTLVEPAPPPAAEIEAVEAAARFTGTFRRDLPDSDFLHWGEGQVAVGTTAIAMRGELAPGPDYKLYLSPEAVTTARDFEAVKSRARSLGDVRAFHGFVVAVPPDVDLERYNTVVIWCETFRKLITAAAYR